MTVVYVPQPPHTCKRPAGDYTPGTTLRCDCGKFWVVEERGSVLRWRPEKRRERNRRERAHRAARMAPPASAKGPLQAPPTASESRTTNRPSQMVILACRHLDPEEGVMRSGHVVTDEDEAALWRVLEAAAEEMGDVAGYAVLEQRPGPPPTTAIYFWPESLYPDAARAEREARRAQAHAELDADLNELIPAYSTAEVRRVKGTP